MQSQARNLPFWLEEAPLEAPCPEGPQVLPACDVAVIGAGFTGLAAALELARAGRSVQVFDRAAPGEGASRRNAGIASGSLYFSLGGAIERFGLEKGVGLHRESKEARESLIALIRSEGIDCKLREAGRFDALFRASHYDGKARECELLNRHLGIGAEMVPRAEQERELGTVFYHGGMTRPDIPALHPGLLHQGLLEKARTAGARVLGHCPVSSFERSREGYLLETPAGQVKAGKLIIGVNGYADEAAPWARRRLVPVASQIIVTEPLAPDLMARLMPKGRAVGESRKMLNYYRPTPDGLAILFGGRSGATARTAEEKAAALKAQLVAIFPELSGTAVAHVWWGNVAYTFDYLPKLAEHDGVLYANGYCGSGVVWGVWLGRKAAWRLLGEEERARTLFAEGTFQSRPLYGGKPWFLPAIFAWYRWQDARAK